MACGAKLPLVDRLALLSRDPGVRALVGRFMDGDGGRETDFSVEEGDPPLLFWRLGLGLTVRGRSIIPARNRGVPLPPETGES